MSASLVGSEMCIRDRRCPRSRSPRPTRKCRTRRSRSRSRPCARPRGSMAVSYTHLTLPTICSV
eukprot:2388453-Alexandrium_andersonii.AAC.1